MYTKEALVEIIKNKTHCVLVWKLNKNNYVKHNAFGALYFKWGKLKTVIDDDDPFPYQMFKISKHRIMHWSQPDEELRDRFDIALVTSQISTSPLGRIKKIILHRNLFNKVVWIRCVQRSLPLGPRVNRGGQTFSARRAIKRFLSLHYWSAKSTRPSAIFKVVLLHKRRMRWALESICVCIWSRLETSTIARPTFKWFLEDAEPAGNNGVQPSGSPSIINLITLHFTEDEIVLRNGTRNRVNLISSAYQPTRHGVNRWSKRQ